MKYFKNSYIMVLPKKWAWGREFRWNSGNPIRVYSFGPIRYVEYV